jgi:glycosyltransferase involved in cell wall biosynthesis
MGIKVEVITRAPKNKKVGRVEKKKNLIIHRLSFMEPQDKRNQRIKGRKLFQYLEKIIKRKKVDLISSQALHLWNWAAPAYSITTNLIAINNDIPNVLTIHAPFIEEVDKIAPKTLFWDKIIGVSNSLSDEIHSLDIEIDKIATCYPGIDLEKFKPDLGKKWLRSRIGAKEKDRIILFAGRIGESKGVPALLKAFSTLSQGKRNIKLLMAVAGRPGKEIIEKTYEKAQLLGIRDKLYILPFELEEMPLVYNGCDIFAMPSQYEGFGLAYAEAMACGLPVVGTSVGGIPEIITNGQDGYLIPPDNPTELAKRLEWLLRSKKKRVEMGRRGVEKVKQKFDLNKTTERLLGVYTSAIKKNGNAEGKSRKKNKEEQKF